MCCHVTFDWVTKNRNCHAHSLVFHNEQKNLDISPSSSFQQHKNHCSIKQAKFHTCKSIFIDFMLQKWKLTKINFTKPHENITYKGSNKANG